MIDYLSLQPHEKAELVEKFNKFVDKKDNDECWVWKGGIYSKKRPYGRICYKSQPEGAHRLAWMIEFNMNIPKGLFCCHRCDNQRCANPHHIFLGNAKANAQDCKLKDRKCKIKLLDRLAFAEKIVQGQSLRETCNEFGIWELSGHLYLKTKEVVAKYGKLDISDRARENARRRELWKKPNRSSDTPQHQQNSTSNPTGRSAL